MAVEEGEPIAYAAKEERNGPEGKGVAAGAAKGGGGATTEEAGGAHGGDSSERSSPGDEAALKNCVGAEFSPEGVEGKGENWI